MSSSGPKEEAEKATRNEPISRRDLEAIKEAGGYKLHARFGSVECYRGDLYDIEDGSSWAAMYRRNPEGRRSMPKAQRLVWARKIFDSVGLASSSSRKVGVIRPASRDRA